MVAILNFEFKNNAKHKKRKAAIWNFQFFIENACISKTVLDRAISAFFFALQDETAITSLFRNALFCKRSFG